jgi:hypothetical protein
MIGPGGIVTGAQAKSLLRAWVVLEDANPVFTREWNSAIDAAVTQSPGGVPATTFNAPAPFISPTAFNPATTPSPPRVLAPTRTPPTVLAQEQRILSMKPEDALGVAQLMYPKLSDRPENLRQRLTAMVPTQDGLTLDNAKLFLDAWLRSDDALPRFQAQWASALGVLTRVGGMADGRKALEEEVFSLRLKPSAALAVARAMYPSLRERPAQLQQILLPEVASADALTERNASPFLSKWISLESPTPAFDGEWKTALANVPH